MPVDEKTAVESSPAAPEPFLGEVPLDSLTDEQYAKWKLTGEKPKKEPKAKQAASPTAEQTEKPAAEADAAKGTQSTGKGTNLKARASELDAEVQELEAKLARRDELKRKLEDPKADDKAAAPSSEAKPPAELKAPTKPKADDYKTWDEYEAARDKYYEDLSEYKVQSAIEKDRRERKLETESKTVAERWNKGVEQVGKDVGTERWNKAIDAVKPLFDGANRGLDLPAKFVTDSEIGPQVAFYLGEHLDELQEIAKLDPVQQIKKLTLIEASLTKPVKTEKSERPGPKKDSEATPPPKDIAGRGLPPKDPVEEALKSGDTAAYIRAANARDVAAKRRVL
jgi:hypothetical protein